MKVIGLRKWATIGLVAIAPFSLSACLILPGEFTSEMTVRQSGDFSFSYKGQIQLIGLANMLNSEGMGETGANEFKAACWAESSDTESSTEAAVETAALETSYTVMRVSHLALQSANEATTDAQEASEAAAEAASEAEAGISDEWPTTAERECTAEEVAAQKKDWDEQQAASKKRSDEQKKMTAMMFGGIDPKDPKSIDRFAKEVERLAAWHKVEHLGNGVFMIDYSTNGSLGDDFAFPVIPRYAAGGPMIHVTRWDNGRLRVEAPAFKTDMFEMFGGRSLGLLTGSSGNGEKMSEPLAVKGTFTLITDAPILANNTDDGPQKVGGMDVLRWDVGPATYGAPMALLKLVQ